MLACPPGELTVGREAIRALWEKVPANSPRFAPEPSLPTLVSGDIALTSTPRGTGRAHGPRWSGDSPTGAGCGCWTSRSSYGPLPRGAGGAGGVRRLPCSPPEPHPG
ncbi:hypothetical protein [Streptomyces sp. GESEQ-13]|uniref:hypothetical protein n=1 Tax=Streptomyces sp. GESEQ-13 TaxID=2812654 RepID=UPI003FD10533